MRPNKPPPSPPKPQPSFFRIVCFNCAEVFRVDAYGFQSETNPHVCNPDEVAYYRGSIEGRAALQAKGLAATTGKAQRVNG